MNLKTKTWPKNKAWLVYPTYLVTAKNGRKLGYAEAPTCSEACKLYNLDCYSQAFVGNDTIQLPSGHKVTKVKMGRRSQDTFANFFGCYLIDVTVEALNEVGFRSSLAQLQQTVCEIAFRNRKQYCQNQLRILQSQEPATENWKADSDKKRIAYLKDELINLTNKQRHSELPVPPRASLCILRRKLGGMYDCRTHRDVPDRNMIEPVRQRRTAQVTY